MQSYQSSVNANVNAAAAADHKSSAAPAVDAKEQKFPPISKQSKMQIFDLQKHLDELKNDIALKEINLSSQRIWDEKAVFTQDENFIPDTSNIYNRYKTVILNELLIYVNYRQEHNELSPLQASMKQTQTQSAWGPPMQSYSIQFWDLQKRECLKTLEGKNTDCELLEVVALINGKLACGFKNRIDLWDIQSEKCETLLNENNSILIALSNGWLAVAQKDNIKVFDGQSKNLITTLKVEPDASKSYVALPEGYLLVNTVKTASYYTSQIINVWNVQTGQLSVINKDPTRIWRNFTILPNGNLVVSYNYSSMRDGFRIEIFDMKKNQSLQTFQTNATIVALLGLPDNNLISIGEPAPYIPESGKKDDAYIRFWDLKTGKLKKCLQGQVFKLITLLTDWRLAVYVISSVDWIQKINVKFLDLGYRSLHLMHIKPILDALESNKTVKILNLQGTLLNDADISALIQCLQNSAITQLNICNTKISQTGVQQLFSACKKLNRTVEIQHEAMAYTSAIEQSINEEDRERLRKTLAEQTKQLAEMKAQIEQLKLQQQTKPVTNLSVSFEIPYNDLDFDKDEKEGDGRKRLGSGGFGVVYKGTWKYQNVAIKELLDQKPSKEAQDEFKKEMQIMAKLRSDHVVRLNGCVLGNPKYCIVMEYMPKGSLFSVLRSAQPLDWWKRYNMATNIASGLAFLHAENILHRDLKSLNVLLDGHYRAKLTDFGLSKLKTETRTTTKNQSVGSEGWTAPELTSDPDAHYTPKCDVFSMGITFWEIAARKFPYEKVPNRSFISFWYAQNKREDIPADCPPKFAHLIKWCWDTDPAKRPTAAEVVKFLRDNENDFKAVNAEANAAAAVNSFPAAMKGNTLGK